MLFSDAAAEYMENKKKRLRATTLEGYASAIRCHLMPKWGGREIESISFPLRRMTACRISSRCAMSC